MKTLADNVLKDELEKELENILMQLIDSYHPQKVILFGSMIEGQIDENSDIDLFIVKDDVPRRRHDRTYELDCMIRRTKATDFLVYKPEEIKQRLEIGDPFVKDIIENGRILYES